MNLAIKGFIIGIGKVLPGISGAMLAITLGEYNKIIDNIATINIDTLKKMRYLSKIGIGILVSIIIMSKIIIKFLNRYYLTTMLLFIGIIIGGIPNIIKIIKIQKKDIMISIICITIIIIISKISNTQKQHTIDYTIFDFIKIIGIGIIDAISSIIPGISGTAILMSIGYYNTLLETFANITNLSLIKKNMFILIPFIVGFLIGTIVISKIIKKLIKKIPNILNIIIVIFMTYTSINLFKSAILKTNNINELIISIILFLLGLIITIKISNKKQKKQYN